MPTGLPDYRAAWLLCGTQVCPRTMLLLERTIAHMLQTRTVGYAALSFPPKDPGGLRIALQMARVPGPLRQGQAASLPRALLESSLQLPGWGPAGRSHL